MKTLTQPLKLDAQQFRYLFETLGPSLGLWRAAEIAALREQDYPPPVLDLGCGDGLVMSRVLDHVAIGLDPDRPALERAGQRGIYERFEPATMEEANLPEGGLGCIVSNSVLEHIERIDEALAAASRALRPGGKLIFTTPTEAFSRWLALPFPRYVQKRNRHFIHVNLWTVEEWAGRLGQVGMEIECARPYLGKNWVWFWDWVELLQMVYIGKKRLAGVVWRGLPPAWMDALARRAAQWDLSTSSVGGGRLIVARKRDQGVAR